MTVVVKPSVSPITDEDVKKEFDQQNMRNGDSLPKNNVVKFQFILLKCGKDKTNCKKISKSLNERLRNGEDFTILARQFSQSPTARRGGIMENIGFHELNPHIQSALSKLTPDDVSIETPIGNDIYYFKLLDIQQKRARSFESEALKIKETLFQRQLNQKMISMINQYKSDLYIEIKAGE